MATNQSASDSDRDAPLFTPGSEIEYFRGDAIAIWRDRRYLTRGRIKEIEGSGYEIKVTMHNRDVLTLMKSVCLLVNGNHHPDRYFGLEEYPVETGIDNR